LHDKIGPEAERAGGILVFFRFLIGFQWGALELKKFSNSALMGGILTPELFFQRGTLEFAMRNVFQHNGWEKNLARAQYLVHDPHRHPQYIVFIVRFGCSPVFPVIDSITPHSATKSSWTRHSKLATASLFSIKTRLKPPSRTRWSSMAARA
jgi:hypothetical protein